LYYYWKAKDNFVLHFAYKFMSDFCSVWDHTVVVYILLSFWFATGCFFWHQLLALKSKFVCCVCKSLIPKTTSTEDSTLLRRKSNILLLALHSSLSWKNNVALWTDWAVWIKKKRNKHLHSWKVHQLYFDSLLEFSTIMLLESKCRVPTKCTNSYLLSSL